MRDLSIADGKRLISGLLALPGQIAEILEREDELAEVAVRLAEAESLFFVGRVRGFPVAREGAQKFKEISYRHAEAYQTSELKHGPLALIVADGADGRDRPGRRAHRPQRRCPARDRRARRSAGRGHPQGRRPRRGRGASGSTYRSNERELDPILLTLPLQLLAYHAARHLGHDIDKPRNLAKSVTVE